MRMFILILIVALTLGARACPPAYSEDYFDFEHGNPGWKIPDWTFDRDDYVGNLVEITSERFLKENAALKVMCDFPRKSWSAAIVEFEATKGIEGKNVISANVFLPGKGRSANLRARIIITVGTGWRIMKGKAVPLKAGEWTRVIAKFDEFEPKEGSAGEASDIVTTENINKIAIRIERDANPWHVVRRYKGPVYIDDVIIGK